MEWLALDAQLEQKKKTKLRRQQRELKRQQKQQEECERQWRKLAQRCAEMQREELLSRAMEQLYKEEAERKLLELRREQDLKMFQQVAVVRKRAQELGLPVATPGLSGLGRLQELETRIADKESALQHASMAKQRLGALPKQKKMLKKIMGEFFMSSLQKKVERAVYKLECGHLLSLFDPESHACGNRADALLNHESKNGFTPLLAAIFCKKLSILRRLLEMGAEPNFETSWGMTPLLASVMTDDVVALSILMEFRVNLSYMTRQGVRAIHLAADKGRLNALKMLCRGGADINATASNGRPAVVQAVISNQLEALKILLAFQANELAQDQNGMSASNWAAKLKFTHMVPLLDSSISTSSLLAQIMEDEEEDSAAKLVSAAAHLAYQRRIKLLETAMQNRDVGRLLQLLEDPSFSPNYEDAHGNTPFLVLCEVGSCKEVMFCLKKKAAPAHQNRNGVNALIAASYRGDINVLELLIAAGCSLLTRDFKGWDCYRYLNKFDHPDAVENLTVNYRDDKPVRIPPVSLGSPLPSTEELRKSIAMPILSSQEDAKSYEPEVDNDSALVSTGRSEAPADRQSEKSDGASNESEEGDYSDPDQDPVIRKWGARQHALKNNRRRRSDFEHERDRILKAARHGRRNGLVAPLPGDPQGRKKFPECINCKVSRARKRCLECEQMLCDKCHARLHELAQRRHHHFEELEPQIYVGHELKKTVEERQKSSLEYLVDQSKACVASMRELLESGFERQLTRGPELDPEVEKHERKKRLTREKEVMQMQIVAPVAAAKHAARTGEGEIFENPAEINLANLYIIQKKYEKAKELLLETQKLVEESIGAFHPTLLKISIGLAKIHQETGHPELCVQTIRSSLGLFESVLPPDHKDVLLALSLLLGGLDSQARYDEAVLACRHWFEVQRLFLGPSQSVVLGTVGRMDEFVSKRETVAMNKEDQIYLEMNKRNDQHAKQQLRDRERRLIEFRRLLLKDPPGLAKFVLFARSEFAEDMINFWVAVEDFKTMLDDSGAKEARSMAVYIFLTYIKSRRIKVITAVQRKKIKKTIATPGKKLPVSLFDEVQNVVFDVIYNGVYARYIASNSSTKQ